MRIRFGLYDDFMETVQLENGVRTPGVIQRMMDGDDPDLDFRTPRLVLKTRKHSMIQPGMVIKHLDTHFIVTTRSPTIDYNTFWLFQADRQVLWERQTPVNDPLTGLVRSESKTPLGNIWVSWEIMARQPIDRQLGVSNETNRVLVGAAVQLNDVIDGQQVKRINESMGVKILEVQ